jgi:hypothetical protein
VSITNPYFKEKEGLVPSSFGRITPLARRGNILWGKKPMLRGWWVGKDEKEKR